MLRAIPPHRINNNLVLPYSIHKVKEAWKYGKCDRCERVLTEKVFFIEVQCLGKTTQKFYHHQCFWKVMGFGSNAISCDTINGIDTLNKNEQNIFMNGMRDYKTSVMLQNIGRQIFQLAPEQRPDQDTLVLVFSLMTLSSSDNDPEYGSSCSICKKPYDGTDFKIHQKTSTSYHMGCVLDSEIFLVGDIESVDGYRVMNETLKIMQHYVNFVHCTKVAKNNMDPNRLVSFGNPEKNVRMLSTARVNCRTAFSSANLCRTCGVAFVNNEPVFNNLFHLSCYFKNTDVIFETPEEIENWDRLSTSVKNTVHEEYLLAIHAGAKPMTLPRRLVTEDIFENPTEPDELGIQQDELEKFRKQVVNCGKSFVCDILEMNKVKYDYDNVMTPENIEIVTDFLFFGVPEPCPDCKGSVRFYPSRRGYFCNNGYLTSFTKCTRKTRNPRRHKQPIPESYKNLTLFRECEWEPTDRLYVSEHSEDVWDLYETVRCFPELNYTKNMCQMAFNNRLPTSPHFLMNAVMPSFRFFPHNKFRVLNTDGVSYQALFTQVDVVNNTNNYAEVMLLRNMNVDVIYGTIINGRIGQTSSQVSYKEFRDIPQALVFFHCEFKKLTGYYVWEDRDNLAKKPGHWLYLKHTLPSILHLSPFAEEVVKFANYPNSRLLLNSPGSRVGKLSTKQQEMIRLTLKELFQKDLNGTATELNYIDATNMFYSMYPERVGPEGFEILRTREMIEAAQMIVESDNRAELQVTGLALCGRIKLNISDVPRDDFMWRTIQRYLTTTHGETHQLKAELLSIVQLEKPNLQPLKSKNRMLLWHAAEKRNIPSCLEHGLQTVSGSFGRGVYLTDSSTVAICHSIRDKQFLPVPTTAYLFLCEVDMGKQYRTDDDVQSKTVAETLKTHDSIMSVGDTRPVERNAIVRDGYRIPMGPMEVDSTKENQSNYNQYVVYNQKQVHLKYLVKVNVSSMKK